MDSELDKTGDDKNITQTSRYEGFTDADIRNALSISGTGMWKLEVEPGCHVRFYGDEIMDDLVGVSRDTTPEDRFDIFMSRINPEDLGVFMSYNENLKKEQSEIIYRYDHPVYGTIYVRCGGKKDETVTNMDVFRGFHQNINQTVRIEQEKRRLVTESAELYQKMSSKLMEATTSTAMYIDLQERSYRWLNCNDKRLVGIEKYRDLGITYSSFMPSEYAKTFIENASMESLAEKFKTMDEYSFSIYVYSVSGELRRITMWYSAVDEQHRYILAVSRDTTEDYQREQQLAEALVEADKANKAKSMFLNNVSHDIRTPMNAIVGFKNLAIKSIDDREKCLEYLSKIEVSSNHLLSLINDVLDMSRIESGKMSIVEAPAQVSGILDELETIFMPLAMDKKITLAVKADGLQDDSILCDKLRVNQVLLNCLSNSVKFTPEGGKVALTVSEQQIEGSDRAIYKFTIADTGIGMSQEFLKSIYEPFTREETGAHQIQGSGLGMSICKKLVDLMNGEINVESELGKGTKFTIYIPFAPVTYEEKPTEADVNAEFSLEGKRVLLVEDNELNQEIATEILKEKGAMVECADDGAQAVEAVKKSEAGHFDYCLMDIQMPVMNGYDATMAIRALDHPDANRLVIIAMTANAFEEDRRKAFECGMNEHITKPINVDEMMKVMGRFS